MPIEYRFHVPSGTVVTTATGAIGDAEIVEHTQRLRDDPAHHPGSNELFDASGVDSLDVTANGVRRCAGIMRHKEGDPSARLAVVVSADVVFGMARMYEQHRDDIDVRVFRELAPAREWLGLPDE